MACNPTMMLVWIWSLNQWKLAMELVRLWENCCKSIYWTVSTKWIVFALLSTLVQGQTIIHVQFLSKQISVIICTLSCILKFRRVQRCGKKSHQLVGTCKILLRYTQIRTLAKKPKSMACNHGDLVPTIVHSFMSNLTLNCLAWLNYL